MGFVNITPDVEETVAQSGVREGLCLVNAMHITASVFINDDEPGLHADYRRWLEDLAPFDPSPERYAHEGSTRFRALGADLLRRIRRTTGQARPGQDHRGLETAADGRRSPRSPFSACPRPG